MRHLPVVSEKKIKMLKTTFVATQIKILQVANYDSPTSRNIMTCGATYWWFQRRLKC